MIAALLVRHSRWFLCGSVFAGLALPGLASALRPLLTPAVAALLILAMLRVDWPRVIDFARHPGRIGLTLAWVLLGSPAVMALALAPLEMSAGLKGALILMAASAPIMSSPALATLLGLDASLALVVVVLSTLLVPLSTPYSAEILADLPLQISAAQLTARLALLVLGSLAVVLLAWRLFGTRRLKAWSTAIDGLSVICLVLFAIAVMDGITAELIAHPLRTLLIILGSFAANLGLQAATALCFWRLGRREALTIALMAGNCNMALLLAALPPDADPDILLYFALGQFPIYILPAAMTPLYRRLL